MTAPDPTPLNLDAIRERVDAATPGPWHGEHSDRLGEASNCVRMGDYGWICAGPNVPEYDVDSARGMADAEFIAHARQDVPTLLAEVDRLRATPPTCSCPDAQKTYAELAAELVRVAAERDALVNGQVPGAAVAAWNSLLNDSKAEVGELAGELADERTLHNATVAERDGLRAGLDMANARLADDEAWQELVAGRDQLRNDLAACRAERDTRARGYERTVNDLTANYRVERNQLRAELARERAERGGGPHDCPNCYCPDAEPLTLGPVGTVMLALADGGFHEDDEPGADIQAAFDAGVKGLTAPPTLDGPSTRALGHVYLSTGCWHGLCNTVRADGTLACRLTCKWCQAPCQCTCHPLPDGDPA